MQIAWLSFFAAFVSLVATIFCVVMMARIDVSEYACCTEDVPVGSAESLQQDGPVCFGWKSPYLLCDSEGDDCFYVGTLPPSLLVPASSALSCLGTDFCPVSDTSRFLFTVYRRQAGAN